MNIKKQCLSCKSKRIIIFKSFNRLKSVSSDAIPLNLKIPSIIFCKNCNLIQKKTSKNYLKNITKIYNNYKLYHQDKKKIGFSTFDSSGHNLSRPKVIFNYFFKQKFNLPKNLKILDFGCGTGINMKYLEKYSTNKNIFGYEKYLRKSTIEKNLISRIYNDNIFQTKKKFDFIMSFFVLEHALNIEEYFNKIDKLLTNDGILLLQVPDIENNPYDFTIYDHVLHFSKSSLINILKKNNFRILKISNNIVKKEITCIVKKKKIHKLNNKNLFLSSKKIIKKSYRFLNSNIKLCKKIIKNNNKFSIFGSSISGNWIFNHFKKNINSFIDEDKNKVGQRINKIKILDLNNDSLINYPIFIPLIPKIAKEIEKRYLNHKFHYIKK